MTKLKPGGFFLFSDKKEEMDRRLKDENRHEKQRRQEKLDSTFGTHTQPTLEKLEYKVNSFVFSLLFIKCKLFLYT